MKKIPLVAVALCALLVSLGFTFQTARQRWEYYVVTETVILDDKSENDTLNGAGLAGWELVTVERGPRGRTYFFKRPKQ